MKKFSSISSLFHSSYHTPILNLFPFRNLSSSLVLFQPARQSQESHKALKITTTIISTLLSFTAPLDYQFSCNLKIATSNNKTNFFHINFNFNLSLLYYSCFKIFTLPCIVEIIKIYFFLWLSRKIFFLLSFFIFVFALFHAIQNWDAKLTKKNKLKETQGLRFQSQRDATSLWMHVQKFINFLFALLKLVMEKKGSLW